MSIAKDFLFHCLEIDDNLANDFNFDEDNKAELNDSKCGICLSSVDGRISYANPTFSSHLKTIAQYRDVDLKTMLISIIKSTVFLTPKCELLELSAQSFLVCVTKIGPNDSDNYLVAIYDIIDFMDEMDKDDLRHLLNIIVSYREQYLDDEFLFDNIFDLITVSDKDGNLIKTNSAIEKQFGIKRELAVGTNVDDLEKNGILSKSVTKEVLKRGTPYSLVQDTSTGHRLLVTSTPVYDQTGQLYKIFNISKDVTTITALEDKLQEAEELINEYEKQVTYMGSNAKKITSNITMQQALNTVMQITAVNSTVLIEGETGVGKDVMARNIHDTSVNKAGPFVKVNCGAIPDSLIESELFGYEKGAFTGALQQGKAGLVASAEGGTLFLDEIGELPLNMQVKLLDLIQTKSYYAIGSVAPRTANIRIIAATNQNLSQMVKSGRFREDLYYRLNVVPLYIPPLRERRSEIPHLVNEFLSAFCNKYNKNKHISREAMALIVNAPWPGNIRELENMIERLVVTSSSQIITPDDLPATILDDSTNLDVDENAIEIKINKIIPLKDAQDKMEIALLEKALELLPNKSVAADVLGIHRTTLSRKTNATK
ncbi:MAG: sigma 54-interacting transcriptional regulator [Bacillota bacterium]|nr:sigma 54-interacting transcriptional regulator [Bacillota bacterium]